eukprot:3858520-Heterocapsa_arctica.AAC.1
MQPELGKSRPHQSPVSLVVARGVQLGTPRVNGATGRPGRPRRGLAQRRQRSPPTAPFILQLK